jgi:protoporphyrinogen oxidase
MIVIIGAGPAGLGASYFATQDCTVIEAEADVGGLCRSFDVGGCTFDLGGHAFFTRHHDILSLIEKTLPGGLYAQPRRAFVYCDGVLVGYPFQANLFGLPPATVAECLIGLVEAAAAPERETESLSDWVDAAFGAGIARHFMRPYNEKVWAYPLDQLRADWVGGRIVKPDVRAIIEGAVALRSFGDFPNSVVRYPNAGGFAAIYRAFAPNSRLMRRGQVIAIDANARTLRLSDGDTLHWSALVSTIPLDVLTAITSTTNAAMHNAAATLAWNSLHLASFAVAAMPPHDWQRIYCASPELPFHKLVLNSNSSPTLRHQSRAGLQAEISFSKHKPVATDGLLQACWSAIVAMGLTSDETAVAAADLRTIERAYPVPTRASKGAREFLTSEFARWGIFCAGRFGTWSYINSDDAFVMGREAIANAERFEQTAR